MPMSINTLLYCNINTHDKVWGYVEVTDGNGDVTGYYSFWGSRGKKLSFKFFDKRDGFSQLPKLAEKKLFPSGSKDPYKKAQPEYHDALWPNLFEELGDHLMMAKMAGTIRTDNT